MLLENDQDKRLSASEALRHQWFQDEELAMNDNLDDIKDGFKEIQENEIDPKTRSDNTSNNFLTVTPVMAGRHLKDTCESPWNPSGRTPVQQDATPMLKHGFSGNKPKRVVEIPGVGAIGGALAKDNSTSAKPEEKNSFLAGLNKLDELNKRKTRPKEGTINFGANLNPVTKKAPEEEMKTNPETNLPVLPNKIDKPAKEHSGEKSSILDKIITSNQQNSSKPNSKEQEVVATPEQAKLEKRPAIPDSDVNIKDEELLE
jgi:hypothetical protein